MILSRIFAVVLLASTCIITPDIDQVHNDVEVLSFKELAFEAEVTFGNNTEFLEQNNEVFVGKKEHLFDAEICLLETTDVCPKQKIDWNTSCSDLEYTNWDQQINSIPFLEWIGPMVEGPLYYLPSITAMDETLRIVIPFYELWQSRHKVLTLAGMIIFFVITSYMNRSLK